MAVTLNANTSTGFIATSDTSGVLQLQTAGTTAVTVDASQNVGIGTTTLTNKFNVAGAIQSSSTLTAVAASTVALSQESGYSRLAAFGPNTSTGGTLYLYSISSNGSVQNGAVINSSGNVGIGTASPAVKLEVQADLSANTEIARFSHSTGDTGRGAKISLGVSGYPMAQLEGFADSAGNGSLRFYTYTSTTTTEKMRINSSGNLLVGTTTTLAAAAVTIVGTTGYLGLVTGRQTTNTAGKFYNWGTSTDASPYWLVYNQDNVGVYIAPGGNTWTSASDETLKENLIPIAGALDSICSLRTVLGNYIYDPEKVKHPFLIAQDVQKVLPEAINQTPEGKLGLQYTDVIPLLVASIKELKALVDTQDSTITQLQADVAALKGATP